MPRALRLEADAKLLLKVLYLLAEGGLRDMQHLCRSGENCHSLQSEQNTSTAANPSARTPFIL